MTGSQRSTSCGSRKQKENEEKRGKRWQWIQQIGLGEWVKWNILVYHHLFKSLSSQVNYMGKQFELFCLLFSISLSQLTFLYLPKNTEPQFTIRYSHQSPSYLERGSQCHQVGKYLFRAVFKYACRLYIYTYIHTFRHTKQQWMKEVYPLIKCLSIVPPFYSLVPLFSQNISAFTVANE